MSDLDLLKRFLQNEIDTGGHKIFVFDKDYNAIEFKTIEALNEINNLENQLQQKENIIKEVREILKYHLSNPSGTKNGWHIDIWNNEDISKLNKYLEILDKENK